LISAIEEYVPGGMGTRALVGIWDGSKLADAAGVVTSARLNKSIWSSLAMG
jgi:hypothetical protein